MGTLVLALSSFLFWKHRHKHRILPLIVSVVGSGLTTLMLKYLLNADRPLDAFYAESTPSFPSGHATIAISLYGFLLLNAYNHDKHPLKSPLVIFFSVLIILIGLSRLYLGVHHVQDVLAGYGVGIIWLFVSSRLISVGKV